MEPHFCGRGAGVEEIVEEMLRQNINWKFNPTAGSHHGGFWDRLIRSEASVE